MDKVDYTNPLVRCGTNDKFDAALAVEDKARAEQEEADRKRREAAKPDAKKLRLLAKKIDEIDWPEFISSSVNNRAVEIVQECELSLKELADEIAG
jgi:hypothetical protein